MQEDFSKNFKLQSRAQDFGILNYERKHILMDSSLSRTQNEFFFPPLTPAIPIEFVGETHTTKKVEARAVKKCYNW